MVIWDDMHDVTGDSDTCDHDEAATRVPGGDWSAPTVVPSCNAQVMIGPTGTALVYWVDSTTQDLMALTAAGGTSFGSSPSVVDNSTVDHGAVAGVVDVNGLALFAWYGNPDLNNTFSMYAKKQNADGSWPSSPETAAAGVTRQTSNLSLAVGPQGDVVAVVFIYLGVSPAPYTYGAAVFSRPAGATPQTWSRYYLITPTTTSVSAGESLAAFDPQDRPTVLFGYLRTGSNNLSSWTRSNGTWSAEQAIESGAASGIRAAMAVDSAGDAQVAYSVNKPLGTYDVRAATHAPGASWSAPVSILGGNTCSIQPPAPSVAFDTQNNALIGFLCNNTQYTLQRLAGSSTYSPFTGPSGASNATFLTDPEGYLIATWTANGITYTSVYDAVAPSVDSVVPSNSPVAGEPTTFTVNGSDVWGPVTFSIDFGDGSAPATGRVALQSRSALLARATVASTVTHVYATAGSYTATTTVRDSAGNSATSTTPIAVAAAGGAGTTPVIPPITGLPDPITGQTVNIFPVKPVVKVKEPGSKVFVPLTAPKQVRVGSIIDARHGRVRITIANGIGGFDTADFYLGEFKIAQPLPKTAAVRTAFANLLLYGGKFKGCPRAPKAQLSSRSKTRKVRKLWGSGNGAFRTVGRYSSATIRGTTWLTQDQCNGTLTKVTAGKVAVRDFVKRKTVVVKAKHKYFAAARKKR
ncbi:MAG: PKD domain-containing protein [Gaiellaceae bacterium]